MLEDDAVVIMIKSFDPDEDLANADFYVQNNNEKNSPDNNNNDSNSNNNNNLNSESESSVQIPTILSDASYPPIAITNDDAVDNDNESDKDNDNDKGKASKERGLSPSASRNYPVVKDVEIKQQLGGGKNTKPINIYKYILINQIDRICYRNL